MRDLARVGEKTYSILDRTLNALAIAAQTGVPTPVSPRGVEVLLQPLETDGRYCFEARSVCFKTLGYEDVK